MNTAKFKYYLAEKANLDLLKVEKYYKKYKKPFLVAKKIIECENVIPHKIGEIYATYLGLAYVNPNESVVDKQYLETLGLGYVIEAKVLPLYKFGKAVTVATCYPQNVYLQDRLEKKLKELVSFVFCFPHDIDFYISQHYPEWRPSK